jgi:hypothetical protein
LLPLLSIRISVQNADFARVTVSSALSLKSRRGVEWLW